MELKTSSRMRMRAAAPVKGQLWHPGPQGFSENDADRGRKGGGVAPASDRANGWLGHPEALPAHPGAIKEPAIVPKGGAYLIEIFGLSAGVLVRDGTRLVFRATHRAFRELDESRFSSTAHAERAVLSSWTRFQHRSRPGIHRGGRSR